MEFTFAQNPSIRTTVNAEENPVKYLAIDPGKHNGVCGYDAKFYVVFMFTVDLQDMSNFINMFEKVSTCIIENFILFPHKAKEQIYSDMGTSRVIGQVENWAAERGIKLVKQQPVIKPTAYKWLGKTPPSKSNPLNHEMDAHAHFMYWAIQNRHVSAKTLVKPRNDND